MATEVKRRRGTTAQHLQFAGAEAEITVDIEKYTLLVHDDSGTAPTGHELLRADFSNPDWTTPDGRYLKKTNNLSDLTNTSAARTNLGLGNVENTALSTYTGQGGALDNQYITNGAGYITSYTETDTLSDVTGRGATTTDDITITYNGIGLTLKNSESSGADTGFRIRGARNAQSYATNNLTSYILLSNYDSNTTPNNYDLAKIGAGMYDASSDTGYLRFQTNNGTALTTALDIKKDQSARFYDNVGVDGNLTVSGDLTVSGTTTTVNTETINLADNIITLNSNFTGSNPTENAGIEVERGDLTNKSFFWDETNDRWNADSSLVASSFIKQSNSGGFLKADGTEDTSTYLTAHPTISGTRTDQNNSGNSFIQDITFDTNGHVLTVSSASASFTDTNFYAINLGTGYSASTKTLTIAMSGTTDVTADLTAVDADKLDGQEGSYYLNYTNFNNTPAVIVDGDFTTAGFMKTDGSGTYSVDGSTYLTSVSSSDVTQHLSVVTQSANAGGELSLVNGEFRFKPAAVSSFIALTDISVGTNAPASGSGGLAYSSTNGTFTYTPPDLSSYLTSFTETNDLTSAVTWANVPDANITSSSVTQHIVIGNPQPASGGGALAFTNGEFIFTPASVPDVSNFITLSEARSGLSVGLPNQASGSGAISYSSSNGVFTYTPPDLSSYLTSLPSHNHDTLYYTKSQVDGFLSNKDNYDHWTISDGTNSGDIDTGATLTVAAGTGITTTYSSSTQTLTISSTLAGGDITAVNTATGSGLSGGASTGAANLQISVLNLTDMTDDVVGGDDELIIRDASVVGNQTRRKAISEIKLSQFNNDAGFVTSTGDNTFVTSASFNTGDGVLTLTRNDTNTVTVDLDGRYLPLGGGTLTGTLVLNGVTYHRTGGSGTAYQRSDARVSSTTAARLHWYGVDTSGSNTNFRHAWYDGSNYVNVTVNSGGSIDFAGSASEINIGSDRVLTTADEGSGNGLDADTLDGQHASAFLTSFDITTQTDPKYLRSDATDTASSTITFNASGVATTFGSLADGSTYNPTEGGSSTSRYWLRFDKTNNASYPYLTNRTPSGDVAIFTGTAAGGAENEHFRIKGGDGTVDAYFTNANVGIGTDSPVANAKLTSMGNISLGIAGNGSNTSGRFISIEGNTDSAGEGSGRIFFAEHNSTTAAMSNYGMSIGYRGGSTSIVGADGNTWTGLGSIANGEWGMWGHNNSATGALIMHGDRAATFVNMSTRLGINGDPDSSFKLDVNGAGRFVNDLYADEDLVVANNIYIGTTDTRLFRSAANTLKTDDDLEVDGDVNVTGTLSATVKSFDIEHPTQKGKRLVYGVLEGNEHAVFVRGRSQSKYIELPEEWRGLVDPDSITVQLTAIGKPKTYYFVEHKDNKVRVGCSGFNWKYDYFYIVHATRVDVEPLQTVQDAH